MKGETENGGSLNTGRMLQTVRIKQCEFRDVLKINIDHAKKSSRMIRMRGIRQDFLDERCTRTFSRPLNNLSLNKEQSAFETIV